MAQKIHVVLEDDIDGGEATETVSFGLDGTTYEIDLNEQNASKLRQALLIFIERGRKVGKSAQRGGRRSASTSAVGGASGPAAKDVREWARANGYDVPDRGRIPSEVRQAYEAAS